MELVSIVVTSIFINTLFFGLGFYFLSNAFSSYRDIFMEDRRRVENDLLLLRSIEAHYKQIVKQLKEVSSRGFPNDINNLF